MLTLLFYLLLIPFFNSNFFGCLAQDQPNNTPSPTSQTPPNTDNDDNQNTPSLGTTTIDKDLIFCIQNGKCGLANICSFNLGNGAEEGRCFGSGCYNMTGHIMRIENDMDYDITFKWDILGERSTDSATGDNKDNFHNVKVQKHSARYFNTGQSSAHSVRLFVGNEPIDTTVASFDQCTPNESCEYLLRVCYHTDDVNAVDPKCPEYARHCHGFTKENTDAKDTCISDCVATYYAQDIQVDPSQIDPDLIIDYLVNGGGVIGSESMVTMMSSVPTGATVTIIVLAVYSLIITIALCVVAWKYWYSARYGYSSDGGVILQPNGGMPYNDGGYTDDYGHSTSMSVPNINSNTPSRQNGRFTNDNGNEYFTPNSGGLNRSHLS